MQTASCFHSWVLAGANALINRNILIIKIQCYPKQIKCVVSYLIIAFHLNSDTEENISISIFTCKDIALDAVDCQFKPSYIFLFALLLPQSPSWDPVLQSLRLVYKWVATGLNDLESEFDLFAGS